jgi:hypothetical protein
MTVERLDISDSFTWEEGLPRPQWDLLSTWVKECVEPDARHIAWTDIARQWLDKLRPELGRDYRIAESEHFLVLAPQSGPPGDVLARSAEACHCALLTALPGVAAFKMPGKRVALVLTDVEQYYTYLSDYYSEGHYGGSAGVHVREGYPHIVLCGRELFQVENALAHESTHAALTHLSLPQWVEEGLAQMFEHNMTGRALLLVDGEMAREHKSYWKKRGLELFWRGEGFSRPDKSQQLSYQLAEILLRLLWEDHKPRWFGLDKSPQRRLFGFLREADACDCGESAARAHLRFGLAELAAKFLGHGPWTPAL